MAAYGTDLTTMAEADGGDAGSFTELASPYNAGGTPAIDTENLIQGTNCYSQTTGTKSGLVFSIVYDYGSNLTFSTDDVVLMWSFYAVISNLDTFANGGLRGVIASDTSNGNAYALGGSDDPYASSWKNVAIDPTKTADYTIGSGNGGSYRYFGMMPNTLASISKGTPHGVDAIRYGRGEIYCVGTGATFTGMANANDLNTSAAFTGNTTNGSPTITSVSNTSNAIIGSVITGTNIPANTTITAVNEGASTITISNNASGNGTGTSFSQYNRFGLLESTGGVFKSKGLMSFGQSGTPVTFSDSNKTIIIDDTPAVYAAFNKIEVNNASSSVTWNNITVTSLGTTSPGRFEMIDNATVGFTSCAFNRLDTFIFLSNATLSGCNWNGCGQITAGGANFTDSNFAGYEGTADTAYFLWNSTNDPNGELDRTTFVKGTAATHAIQFSSYIASITLTDVTLLGYNASDGQNDSALYFPDTGVDRNWTVNVVGGSGNFSYKKVRAGDTVTIVQNPVSITVTVRDEEDNSVIQYAAVTVKAAATGPLPYLASVTITRSGSTATVSHTAHGLSTGQKVEIRGADQNEYNRIKTITVIDANSYSFTVNGTPTTPATGTITSTAIIIDGETNASGQISDTRTYAADQDYTGLVQQGTRIPIYKARVISGTIDKDVGRSEGVLLTKD